jgi:hypothetical protein
MTEPLLAEANPTSEGQTDPKESVDSSSAETKEQPQQKVEKVTEKPEVEGAPETYEFKAPKGLPKGVEIDAKIRDAYSEVARELNLPQEKAQGLFDKTMIALHGRAIEEQSRQSAEWVTQAKADSEYGGAKLDENLGRAKKAITEFGSDGLRELLDSPTGLGNHPEVIRFMVRVGKAISEDRFVGSNQGRTLDPSDDAVKARKLYPSAS